MYNKQVIVLRKLNCVAYESQDSSLYSDKGDDPGFQSVESKRFFRDVQTSFGSHQASCSVGLGVLSLGGGGMKLTTHLLVVLSLRVSGAVLLLLLYAFILWTGTILTSTFTS
jgi:hypothetical protein